MEQAQITITSTEFMHNVSAAKRAVVNGHTVIVTARGEPSIALVPIAKYRQMSKTEETLRTAIAIPAAAGDFEFEPPKITLGLRIPDLEDDE